MGRTKTVKPPTPMAPPPPVEEVDAEFIAPTMRQLAARRARRGAYITGAERKLGGKPRVSGKEASAIADKTVREIDPLKGFEKPERGFINEGTRRQAPESDQAYAVRQREAEAEFLQKEADVAGAEALKSKAEFEETLGERRYKRQGALAQKETRQREAAYKKYLEDYVGMATGRIKRGYRTTQLRNLGLM